MEPRTIVAIEIASSKIKGAAAAVDTSGHLSVLAVEELAAAGNVRYGRVQNIREVSAAVNEIVSRLESAPAVAPRTVRALAIAVGGRSLSGQHAKASLKFPHECEITEAQVKRLSFEASRDLMGDAHCEDTIARTFYVNNSATTRPVGTFGELLRGEFTIITCGRETRQNLDRLKFDSVENDKDHRFYIVRPTAVADFILTPDEKELGAALVDIGSQTTTVAVYSGGSLSALCTIPMGSRLIDLDLSNGLGITEEAAEAIKIKYAASPSEADSDVRGYVRTRVGEIAANILNQLEHAGFNAQQLTKLVLTGGGAMLPDFTEIIAAQGKASVRVADMPADITFRVAGKNNAANIDILAILSAAARRGCTSCLEAPTQSVPTEQPAVFVPLTEEEEEIEDEEEMLLSHETVRTSAESQTARLIDDDENDDIFIDDQDDPEDEQPAANTRQKRSVFSIFNPFKKSDRRSSEPDDDYDDTEEEDEDDNTQVSANGNERNTAKKIVTSIEDKLVRLFTPDDDDDIERDEE